MTRIYWTKGPKCWKAPENDRLAWLYLYPESESDEKIEILWLSEIFVPENLNIIYA